MLENILLKNYVGVKETLAIFKFFTFISIKNHGIKLINEVKTQNKIIIFPLLWGSIRLFPKLWRVWVFGGLLQNCGFTP